MPRLFIDIAARFAQFQDALDKIATNTAAAASRMSKHFDAVDKNVKRLITGFVILRGIRFANSIVDDAEKLATLSERTGIGVKALNGLAFAAKQSGTDLDTMASALKNLQKSISEVGTGNKELTRLFEDVLGKGVVKGGEDVLEIFLKIADAFPRIAPNDRPRVLMEAMKKSADELGPAMLKGRAGLVAYFTEADRLNPRIEESAAQAKAFNDSIDRAARAIKGVLQPAIDAVLPSLEKMADEFARAGKEQGFFNRLEGFARGIGAGFLDPFRRAFESIFGVGTEESLEQIEARLERLRTQLQLLKTASTTGIEKLLNRGDRKDLERLIREAEEKRAAIVKAQAAAKPAGAEGGGAPIVLRGKDTTKETLDQRLRALDRSVELEGAKHAEYLQLLEGFAELGVVPYQELAEGTKLSLQTLVANTNDFLDKQIKLLKAFAKENANDPAKVADAEDKIAAAIAKKEETRRRAALAGFEAGVKEETQTQAVRDQVELLHASLLELRGETEKAFAIKFRIENRELLRNLTPQQRSTANELRDVQAAGVQARALDADAGRIQSRLAAQQEAAKTARQVGAITELEAMQRISEAHKQAAVDTQGVIDKLEKIAPALRTPEINAQIASMRLELERLGQSSDLVRDKFQSIFSDASSNTLVGVMEGRIKSLRDALKSFTDDLAKAFNDIAARAISDNLFGAQGALGSVPSFLSSLVPGNRGAPGAGGAGAAVSGEAASAALVKVGAAGEIAAPAVIDMGLSSEVASGFVGDFGFAALEASAMANVAADAFLEAAIQAAASQSVAALGAAKGRVFDGGVSRFARGDVFNSPTLFKFASGGGFRTGLMGEAGPEAVMPLKRGKDGRLGVEAAGGGGVSVVNNFMLMSPADQRTQAQIARQAGQSVARAMRRDG
jgi:hypothetical protein